tara:strand:- start:2659 stop:3009 length:351 start_codon:yes stop_codon:yes gene_type:complete
MAIKNKQTPTPQPIPIPKEEINQNNIPSPSDIKNSPVSFSQEEIKTLRSLKNDITQLSIEFGTLTISKIKLEEQEKMLKKKLTSLEEKEKTLADTLTKKYGKGSIDLDSGTFTPLK